MLWHLGQIQQKNRAKIRNRKRIHRSPCWVADSHVRAIYEVRLCCIWFLKTRLLYILGLDNCKAGVQKLEGAFPSFSKTPQGPPYPLIHSHVWGEVHVQEVVHANSSCEALLGSGLGLWFSMSKAVSITLLGQVISRRTLANMTGKRYALLVTPGDHWVHWPDRRSIWIGFAHVVRQMMKIMKVITNQKPNLAQLVMSSLRLVWCDFRTLQGCDFLRRFLLLEDYGMWYVSCVFLPFRQTAVLMFRILFEGAG